jgi:hypothetical protein
MAQLVLTNLPPAVVAKLEERARDTNTTVDDLAGRLLARAVEEEGVGWTIGSDGWPLYTGAIDSAVLDHRAAREERIDQFVREALEGHR